MMIILKGVNLVLPTVELRMLQFGQQDCTKTV